MLNQRKQSLTPLALLEPDIPGRTRPIMDSGEWGINLAAAKLNFPEDGLLVQIPVWLHKGLGDLVELLLHEKVVDQKYIEDPAELTQRTTLWVAERHIPSGSYSLSYRVTRLNQTPETQTPPLRLYVKLELPGGQDTNPEPGHSNLFMHIPPEIISGGVDKEVAEAGVPITIRSASGTGLPYPNIAEGDCVILSWGGIFMFSDPVTDLQISDPVNHPLIIHVTKEVIERSGDSDSSGLAVTYKLRDIVGNESTDWSDAIRIVVNIGISLLLAPIVKEAINNVIDLDELGDDQLTAQVWATDSTLQKNDVIHLKMRGTTESGETIEVAAEPQTVDNLPHTYEFYFDNVDVRKLTNTQVTFLYTVVRADTPEPLRSKGQFVQVIGEAQRLAAPRVIDEHQGAINPDLHYVRLHIPHNPLIVQGSALDIIWFGRRPDGSTHNPELDWYFPDNQEASDPEGFVITVATIEDNHLKTLEGGTLTIAYYLLTVEGDDTVSRESRHTNAFQVGEPQFELIKPDILGEQDGVLKPEDLSNGTSRLTAPRPTGTPSENKDVVIFTWFGEITGKVEDSVTLNALSANRDVNFNLNAAFVATHIVPNHRNKVTASYRILRFESGKTSYSNPRVFYVGEAPEQLLNPAKVREAVDDVLDPANAPSGATVWMEANRSENAGDHFFMKWRTADGSVAEQYDKTISGNNKGKEVEFPVPRSVVLASENHEVIIEYYVELFEGGTAQGENYTLRVEGGPGIRLPVATFKEASGPQKDQLNPDDVFPTGATVVIEASAGLKTDDLVHVEVVGKTTYRTSHSVLADEQDSELAVIKIEHTFIANHVDERISLAYTITRNAGGTDGPSASTVYDVRRVIGTGLLKVMGARYTRGTYRSSGGSHVISAFNATTGQPLPAEWKYSEDSQWTTGNTWYDTHPEQLLQVRTADDALTLNRANILGNGNDLAVNGEAAFVAHRDLGDMAGWGNSEYGARIPSTIITMDDIVEVSSTRSAFAARRANNAVVVWGNATEGGNMTGVSPLNFKQVVGNSVAFAGLKLAGQLVAWGAADHGGTVPAPISNLTDITQVIAAGQAFAAQRITGHLVAWGLAENGGSIPDDIAGFTDIKTLIGSFGAFAAHRGNGRIIGWGNPGYGGEVPEAIALLTDIIELSSANAQAFVARRASGQLVAWGTPEYGGTIDPLIEGLTDIVEICSTWRAFAARRHNGHVVAWGRSLEGGSVPEHIAMLNDIVQVCGSSQAFAALRKNGTVVAWGNAELGGDTAPVVDQLTNVQALYSNSHGFTALTSDARVVTWGHAVGGGDSSAAQDRLRGKVSYLSNPVSRGVALTASHMARLRAFR